MNIEQVAYGGWTTCYKMSNDRLELIVTAEVGPRIIHLSLKGGKNLFAQVPEHLGKTGGQDWRMYGGHRFWHAPENNPRSYLPDNSAVQVRQFDDRLWISQPVEERTGIQKEIELWMSEDSPQVQIRHRLSNTGLWPVELAPWALSVMAAGGQAVVPLPARGSHPEALLPSSSLILWPYTDLSDSRWRFGQRYICLQQDSSRGKPQKIGLSVPDGWAAYHNKDSLFLKCFEPTEQASYPDRGSQVEVFTNDFMLELETLGALSTLRPGASCDHVESWFAYDQIPALDSDDAMDEHLLPLVREAKNSLS